MMPLLTAEEIRLLIALTNWALCSFLGSMIACRIHLMDFTTTRPVFRANYAVLFSAAAASGFSPLLFGEWPTITQVGVTAAFAFVFASGAPAWRRGIPDYARKPLRPGAPHPWRRLHDKGANGMTPHGL